MIEPQRQSASQNGDGSTACSLHGVLQRDGAGISPTRDTARISLSPCLLPWKLQILVLALLPWNGSLLRGAHRLWACYRTTTEEAVNTSNSNTSCPALCSSTSIRSSLVSLCNTAPQPPLASGLTPSCWWYRPSCYHECCPVRPPKTPVSHRGVQPSLMPLFSWWCQQARHARDV